MNTTMNIGFQEISMDNMDEINGGIAPLVIAAGKLIIGAAAGGAGWAVGEWLAKQL